MQKLHTSLSKRFISGLEKRGITLLDIENNYYYIGGEEGDHLIYFNQHYPELKMPEHHDVCICGHRMKSNCYISNGETILALGENCCKKFIKQKSCGECGEKHRNRKDNLCCNCRKKFTRVWDNFTISFA